MCRKISMASVYVMIVFAVTDVAAHAADYHVSPSGNDTNSGTADAPWQTIVRVNRANLEPGDRVLFEGGQTFSGMISLNTEDSGTPDKNVVIGSFGEKRSSIDGGKGAGLVAEGCDYLQVNGINFKGDGRKNGNDECGVKLSHAEGCSINEVDVEGFRLCGVEAVGLRHARITKVYAHDNGSTGIGIGDEKTWSEDVYIGYCIAENNPGDPKNLDNHSGSGIVAGCVRGCVVEYCEAMNNGWDMPREGNGPVGIWTWNADRVIIQNCISHDNKSPSWDGGGFDIDGGVTNSIVQYNLSYNNVGPGYLLCQYYPAPIFKNNIVRYNISQNDGKKGENASFTVSWYEGMSDTEIYNNTFYNETGPAVSFNKGKAPGMHFRNNIFVSGTQLIAGGAVYGQFENNVYWLLNGKPFEVDGFNSIEAWSKATGQERIGEYVAGKWGDPRLVRPGQAKLNKPEDLASLQEYRLEKDSPCIGAGMPIGNNGGRDFWGNSVPEGEKPTIGAQQR
jgi:hypothetical protein